MTYYYTLTILGNSENVLQECEGMTVHIIKTYEVSWTIFRKLKN